MEEEQEEGEEEEQEERVRWLMEDHERTSSTPSSVAP